MQDKQTGAALITVMLVVAIATILLTMNITKSYDLSLQERALSNQAITQELFYLAERDAIAKLENILMQNRDQSMAVTFNQLILSKTPIAQSSPEDYPDWQYQVFVHDLQARLNINTLEKNQAYQQAFARLSLGLSVPEANAIADWLDPDTLRRSLGAEDDDYLAQPVPYLSANQRMTDESEIRFVDGMSREAWFELKPYLVALPSSARVNINTASEELIRALAPQLDIYQIIAKRDLQEFYSDRNEMRLSGEFSGADSASNLFTLTSNYYELDIQVTNSTSVYKQLSRLQLEGGAPVIYHRSPGLDIPEHIILGNIK